MSMNQRERAELERLQRENKALKEALAKLEPEGPVWYDLGAGLEPTRVFLPPLAPVHFLGLQVRVDSDGLIDLNGEDGIVLHPLASNHVKVLAPIVIRRRKS